MGWRGPEPGLDPGDNTARVFCPSGLALTARGSQTPSSKKNAALGRHHRKVAYGRSEAETIRRRRDRLEWQPQERQHSAAVRRDAGPTGPGEAFNISARGPSPEAEARIEKRSARSDKSGI